MTLDLLIMVYLWTKRIKFLFLMFGINGPPYMQQWVRQIKTKIIVEYEPRYKRVVAFVSVAIEVWQKQADKRKTHIKVKWERGTNTSVSQEGSQSKAEFRGDRNIFEFINFFLHTSSRGMLQWKNLIQTGILELAPPAEQHTACHLL